MTTQIAVRLDDTDLQALDREVAEGRASSRSDAVRRGIAYMAREHRYQLEEGALLELARRGEPLYPDLEGLQHLPRPPLES